MDAVAAGELGGIHFLDLAVLVICWSILLIATWNALDTYGVILVCSLIAASIWVLIDWGLLRADSGNTITWNVLYCAPIRIAEGPPCANVCRRPTSITALAESEDNPPRTGRQA